MTNVSVKTPSVLRAGAVALLLAGVPLTAAHAQIGVLMQPPAISVNGDARISVAPDRAEIDGGVITEAKTAREATQANNTAMAAVLTALKNSGIDEKDFQTSRLSLQPQSSANRGNNDGPVRIIGYRASNRVTVRIRDIAKVAQVIDTLTGAGANTISGISFSVSQASKLLDEARTQAMADARRKAEIYANAAGVTLGPPLNINEGMVSGPIPVMRQAKFAAADAMSTPVAPGEEVLHVNVSVSYAITPAKP